MAPECSHLGHLVLECFRKRPHAICQIDASTGEEETNASVLSRSIRVAYALRAIGLVPGDAVALSGRNHLDLRIPYYAALFNGLPVVGSDSFYKYDEIKRLMALASPKIAFCELQDYEIYTRVAQELGSRMRVVAFRGGEYDMNSLVREHGAQEREDDFEAAAFDTSKVYMSLISTSGTSGVPKLAAITYDAWLEKASAYLNHIKTQDSEQNNQPALNVSTVHWVSGYFNGIGMPLLRQTIVQTSGPRTVDHIIDVINKYKPRQALFNTTIITQIVQRDKKCDLTCFDSIIVTGAKLPDNLMIQIRSRMRPGTFAAEFYGQTETLGPVLAPSPSSPPNSCGKPSPIFLLQVKLVYPDTGVEITEPHVNGEMVVKGALFTEYYNSPDETKQAFTEDGWYKTGDLLYRDAENNYFYVDRIKAVIKYQSYHVIPRELEDLIRTHPGVSDVVVVGIPHPVDGEHPAACVVAREGATFTAQEIKDIVANTLSQKKALRGGVIFLKEYPLTSTGKISLVKVKNIAINIPR